MKETCERQLTFDGYRVRETDRMLQEMGVPHPSHYRRKMTVLFSDNVRVNGTASERLYDWVKLKLEFRQQHENHT